MNTQLPISKVGSQLGLAGNSFVPIRDFNRFANIFHDRIHAVTFYFMELEGKFTLITNLLDRSPHYLLSGEDVLIYAGAEAQRRILEKPSLKDLEKVMEQKEGWKHYRRKKRDENWAFLESACITRDLPGVETFKYFDQFVSHKLDFGNLTISYLRDYFRKMDNPLKENELPILQDYFDIQNDLFLSIPVISFGKFEGVMHLIFQAKDREQLNGYSAVKLLVKLVQMEYEGLILDWDSVGENIREKSQLKYKHLEIDDPYVDRSPIMGQLNTTKYYQSSDYYYRDRIEASNEISQEIHNQQRQLALITILLDSYSHNISAHSLTVLNWWFKELAEFLRAIVRGETFSGKDINPLINHYQQMRLPLAKELFPLFRFLMEKGAFWSGITRQTNFTGRIRNLFSVLWEDFLQNPLYLGTIANSEKINKLHIYISIFERECREENENFINRKYIKEVDGQLLDGRMVTVNLVDFKKTEVLNSPSPFVEKAPMFEAFRQELSQYEAFFPSGVVGKHAFFTLIENEIRNVKHYKGAILEKIQREGLILNISVHERPFDSENTTPGIPNEIFKIGIWLRHPVELGMRLAATRLKGLREDILTENFRPRLGGNFQDKICAAMLLNNTFRKVQDMDSKRGEIYYPWIKTASAKAGGKETGWVEDFEISLRKYEKYSEKEFAKLYPSGWGYLKKYFHLWKGAAVCGLDEVMRIENENIARFRFVYSSVFSPGRFRELKAKGVVRLISGPERPAGLVSAYEEWLRSWVKVSGGHVIDFYEEGDPAGRLVYNEGKVHFLNVGQIADMDRVDETYNAYLNIPHRTEINMNHGGEVTDEPDKCNYRSHGVFMREFCQADRMSYVEAMEPEKAYELYESLTTRICLFDRRLYGRICKKQVYNQQGPAHLESDTLEMQERKLAFYRSALNIDFQDEALEAWKQQQEKGFVDNYHFLIVHLSFIENMLDSQNIPYGEKGIQRFIQEQVLQDKKLEEVGNNFILVITTGRGRMEWWKEVAASPYLRFTTFRPIESILAGVEDALILPDDFGVKYNVAKELLGS